MPSAMCSWNHLYISHLRTFSILDISVKLSTSFQWYLRRRITNTLDNKVVDRHALLLPHMYCINPPRLHANRALTLKYMYHSVSWVSTHGRLNKKLRFWPTWALTWDIASIRLYRTCYIDKYKYMGMGACPEHYGIGTSGGLSVGLLRVAMIADSRLWPKTHQWSLSSGIPIRNLVHVTCICDRPRENNA